LDELNFDVSKSIFTNSDVQEVGNWYVERTKYIPLRLTYEERKYLRLLEATLNVSEYTGNVNVILIPLFNNIFKLIICFNIIK